MASAYSIKVDSRRKARVSTDLDNLRSRYMDTDDFFFYREIEQIEEDKRLAEQNLDVLISNGGMDIGRINILTKRIKMLQSAMDTSVIDQYSRDTQRLNVTFPSGEIYSFEKNLYVLISESKKVPFKAEWTMRPDYVSHDMYNSEIYWPMILFVNRVYMIEEFTGFNEILVPPLDSILFLTKDRIPYSDTSPLYEFVPKNILTYFQRHPLDDIEIEKRVRDESLKDSPGTPDPVDISGTLVESSPNIIITTDDILNKRVALANTPINNSSIVVKINDYDIIQRYGYDYFHQLLSDGTSYINWDGDLCELGDGMVNILSVGDILHVEYAYGMGRLANICYNEDCGHPGLIADVHWSLLGLSDTSMLFMLMFGSYMLVGFPLYDADSDGGIPLLDTDTILQAIFGSDPIAEFMVEIIIRLMDRDYDGYIEPSDLIRMFELTTAQGIGPGNYFGHLATEMIPAFNNFDSNGNGQITLAEFISYFPTLFVGIDPYGDNTLILFFLETYETATIQQRPILLEYWFDMLDEDGVGVLTTSELTTAASEAIPINFDDF